MNRGASSPIDRWNGWKVALSEIEHVSLENVILSSDSCENFSIEKDESGKLRVYCFTVMGIFFKFITVTVTGIFCNFLRLRLRLRVFFQILYGYGYGYGLAWIGSATGILRFQKKFQVLSFKSICQKFCEIYWWKERSDRYPILAKYARRFLRRGVCRGVLWSGALKRARV